jgi:hypothetical protein
MVERYLQSSCFGSNPSFSIESGVGVSSTPVGSVQRLTIPEGIRYPRLASHKTGQLSTLDFLKTWDYLNRA